MEMWKEGDEGEGWVQRNEDTTSWWGRGLGVRLGLELVVVDI